MPIVLFLLLVVLIAQIGFWKTFAAVLGAIGVVVLLVVIAAAIVAVGGAMVLRRRRR